MQQKSLASLSGHLFLRAAIASILAAIVYMSVAFIFTSLGTEKIGYTVYRQENGVMVNLGDHYTSEIDALEEEAQQGESVDEETGVTYTYYTQSIRSDMPLWMKVVSFVIAEICMIGIYTSMLYVTAWEDGNRTHQWVRYEHGKADPLRGLKAGLIASIPCLAVWLLLLISRFSGVLPSFGGTAKWFFIPYFPIAAAALPSAASADTTWWAFPVLLALAAVKPLTCHFAYRMGYADKTIKAFVLYKGDEKVARKKKR